MADIATLGLKVDATGAIRELRTFDRALATTGATGEAAAGRISKGLSGLASRIRTLGPLFAASAVSAGFAKYISETIEAQNAQAQLEAAVRSTGGAAGQTVGQLNAMAGALQRTTTFSDGAAKGAQAILLAFTNIKGAEFPRAMQAIADISARTGRDMASVAGQVGKALNSPAAGLRTLASLGVSFSEGQKVVIQKLVDTGREAEAMRLILARLEGSYAGAAAASRDTLGGALAGLKNQFGQLFEASEKNARGITAWVNKLSAVISKYDELTKKVQGFWGRVLGTGPADFTGAQSLSRASGQTIEIRASQTEEERQAQLDKVAEAARRAKERLEDARRAAERFRDMLDSIADIALRLSHMEIKIPNALTTALSADRLSFGDGYRPPRDPRADAGGRTPLMVKRDLQDAEDAKAKEKAARATDRLANTMNISSQIISASAANFLVGKLGGNTAGGNIGGAVGGSAFGSLGGSVSKLLEGGYGKIAAAILGPLGQALAAGIGALVGKVVGSIFGSTSEERALERQARAAQRDVAATMEILRAKSLGLNTALLEQIEANRKYYEAVKLQINAALPGTKNEAERNRQRAEVDALSANEAERIRRDYERTQREKREDLEVRGLRAQGKGSEADKLALQIEHAREIMEAERPDADAAYIARLKEIQAIEKTASALNALTTSVQNAPSGFKVESYINQFAQARPWNGNGSIPGASIPYSPQLPTGMTPRSTANVFNISGPVTIDAKDKTPKQAFDEWGKVFAKEKASTVGINVSASEAFDYIF